MTSIKRVPLDRFDPEIDAHPFRVDVEERDDSYRVVADLPGCRESDIDVVVRGDRVRITVDYGDGLDGEYLRRERLRGERRRVIRLPLPVDEQDASTSFRDGVLRLTLRKSDRSQTVDIA